MIRIIQGDCREKLDLIPDGSINLIATDPPYAISKDVRISREGGKFGRAKAIDLDFGDWDREALGLDEWVPKAVKKLTPVGVFISFYDQRKMNELSDMLEGLGMTIRHYAIWKKSNPSPMARKVSWQTGSESFTIATRNSGSGHHYNFGEGQQSDVVEAPVEPHSWGHPTQKPEAVVESMVKWWSWENDTVLDLFAGSGTTGAVCQRLNRKCILIERNPKWADTIVKRLSKPLGCRIG